jgi:hypothetical protein
MVIASLNIMDPHSSENDERTRENRRCLTGSDRAEILTGILPLRKRAQLV